MLLYRFPVWPYPASIWMFKKQWFTFCFFLPIFCNINIKADYLGIGNTFLFPLLCWNVWLLFIRPTVHSMKTVHSMNPVMICTLRIQIDEITTTVFAPIKYTEPSLFAHHCLRPSKVWRCLDVMALYKKNSEGRCYCRLF